uniref:Uncharacterized protein n=1 Tax=Romanomermis culicivorax TaxID=13658 RepID=A0A915I407_ROMCU
FPITLNEQRIEEVENYSLFASHDNLKVCCDIRIEFARVKNMKLVYIALINGNIHSAQKCVFTPEIRIS